MKIYTKHGDAGTTSLVHAKNIAKSDDRVEVLGAIDELTSHLGLLKTKLKEESSFLEEIQQELFVTMKGIADSHNMKYKIKDDVVNLLEKEIDRISEEIDLPSEMVLPGSNERSAQIDIARTVARRAERSLSQVSIKYGSDGGAKRFLNRLSDYLYVLARYYEQSDQPVVQKYSAISDVEGAVAMENQTEEALIQKVLMRMGQGRMNLELSKKLIEKIEEEALRRGKRAVIAICGPDGNPIAVHVMDGAFLVSFDVAVKKAYTSVAVKMSTMELSKLAQPGQTFYGVDKMDNGKIVIFGGGVPLVRNGNIIGGLGISGGTGEEDHSLAEYALSILDEILK